MNTNKRKSRANTGRPAKSSGLDKSLTVDGIYNNAIFMHALANQIGNTIRVETQNGVTFEGIFKAYSSNFEVALGMTHKVDPMNPSSINVDEVKEILIFKPQEIVTISATDVDLEFATKDTFQTDTAISKFNGQIFGERELEPWVGPGCNGDDIELDTNDTNENGWDVNDMFRKNEQMYGVQSTFDHNMSEYTVQLQRKDTKDYKDAEAKAAKIANEIENNPSHKARVDVENGDEEDKYAAVVRPDSGNSSNTNSSNGNTTNNSRSNSNSNNSSNISSNCSSNSSNNSASNNNNINSNNNNTSSGSSSSDSGKYVPPAKRKNQVSGKLGAKNSAPSNGQHLQHQPTLPTPSISPVQSQPQVKKPSPPVQFHHNSPLPFTAPPAVVSQPPPQPYPPSQPLPQRERQDQRVNGQFEQLPPSQPKGPRQTAPPYPMRSGPPRVPYQSEFISGNRYQSVEISQPRVPPPPQTPGAQPHHHLGPTARNAPALPPHLHHPQHVPHSSSSQMNQGGQMLPAQYPPNSVPSIPPGVHSTMQTQPPQHISPLDLHRKSPASNIVSEQHNAVSLPSRKQQPRRDDQISELKKFGSDFKLAEPNVTSPPCLQPLPNHADNDVRIQLPPPQHQQKSQQPSPPQPQPVQSPQRQQQQQQPPPPPQQHQQQQQQTHTQQQQQISVKNDKSSTPSSTEDKSGANNVQTDGSNDSSPMDKVTSTLKKSTLNPNAKEFVYNPNAKPFTPVSNQRSPSTPVASRPHTPQTPNYSPMPMMMPAYVVAAQPTYPPTQAAGNRYRKVQIVPHRSDITSQMTAAAVTGQPLLAPAPIHATPFTVPYTGPHIPPQPYQQMVRMVPQVPLVPTSISYHEPPTPQPTPTIQFMPPHHPTTPSPAHNGHGNQTPQNGHPPPSYGQTSGGSGAGGQHSSSGVGSYAGGPTGHPPPYPIMCPILPTGPPTGPPGAHHAAAMAAATQQQFIHHHQHPQIAGQHPQHIQVILPQNQ